MKMLKVTDHGETRYVPDYDSDDDTGNQSTAIVRSINPEAITRDAMAQNSAMVANLLKQFAPTIDAPGYRNPPVAGIASPAELAARNQRFRWTVIALIVLSSIAVGGIVLVAVVTGNITPALGVSAWIALTGISAMLATWHVHRTELQHSPEAIELERTRGEFDIATQDGETKRILIEAYAESIKLDAQTKQAYAEAQRLANLSLLNQPKPQERPQRARATVYDEIDLDDYTQPVCAPESPVMATYDAELPVQPLQPAVTPDRDLVAMLEAIDRLYSECEQRDSDVIVSALPWGNRGDWSIDAKTKADKALDYFTRNYDTPLVYRGNENGARWRLNRQVWKRNIARAIIAREWNI
jgi:hypothetical protein